MPDQHYHLWKLSGYFIIQYKPGKTNQVAYALSRQKTCVLLYFIYFLVQILIFLIFFYLKITNSLIYRTSTKKYTNQTISTQLSKYSTEFYIIKANHFWQGINFKSFIFCRNSMHLLAGMQERLKLSID